MSDYFEHIEPQERLDLPEALRSRGAEGLMPRQIVFPRVYDMLAMDKDTNELFVCLDNTIDDDASDPKYTSHRFGLMRVYQRAEDGTLLDGFVADLRLDNTCDIPKRDITGDADYYNDKYMPLSGLIYTDLDMSPRFRGKTAFAEVSVGLAMAVDDRILIEESEQSVEEPIVEVTEPSVRVGEAALNPHIEVETQAAPISDLPEAKPPAPSRAGFWRKKPKKDN